jgi:hypothetical protein
MIYESSRLIGFNWAIGQVGKCNIRAGLKFNSIYLMSVFYSVCWMLVRPEIHVSRGDCDTSSLPNLQLCLIFGYSLGIIRLRIKFC